MVPKLATLAGLLLVSLTVSNAARTHTHTGSTMASMASRISATFSLELQRMQQERHRSEEALKKTVTLEGAYTILQKARRSNASALAAIEEGLHGGKPAHLRAAQPSKSFAQKAEYTPSSSIQKANTVLGEMITEVDQEYDQLHLECSQFFKKQCSLMEVVREDISSANSWAAHWRSQVLGAQSEINVCEVKLPKLKFELSESIRECTTRLGYLRRDLQVVMNDVDVMERVIKLTDCSGQGSSATSSTAGATTLLQAPNVCHCARGRGGASFATIGHPKIHEQLSSLKSQHVQRLVQEGLLELSADQGAEDSEAEAVDAKQTPTPAPPTPAPPTQPPANITAWKNPPLPQAQLPSDPCQGISYDDGQGGGGCTLRKTPACFNLQNKFLTIQGETIDKRDDLLDEIKNLEAACKETQDTLTAEIDAYTAKQAEEHTKLAEATAGENGAGEEGQTKSRQHLQLKKAMFAQRSTCSKKFRSLESEVCALKKIRGELNKYKGDTHPFFQDCEVAETWEEKDCSASCGGGVQELVRAVITPASGGGAQCPPTKQVQRCNEQPCPINCKVSQWSGWSACSADCGGGVLERTRSIKVQPRYGGTPCEEITETTPCNMQACDKDCVLAKWTAWSACSKACDGGRETRIRKVKTAAVGRGKCPTAASPKRLERKVCNTMPCIRDQSLPLQCHSALDLVLLLDGSGSVGSSGWEATKLFAKTLVSAFKGPAGYTAGKSNTRIAVILYSGPYYYSLMRRCAGSGTKPDMETDCKVKMVNHFTNDTAALSAKIDQLQWPRGTTLTSQALELANSELVLGRSDAEKVVLAITDGIPLSARATSFSAARLRKKARLMFAAVRMSSRGLRYMMHWGSKPTKENVLKVNTFNSLKSMDTIDTLIIDMCKEITTPTGGPAMMVR